jgi:hypothetical protein
MVLGHPAAKRKSGFASANERPCQLRFIVKIYLACHILAGESREAQNHPGRGVFVTWISRRSRTVSDEYKWRPLGSVVNGVLRDVKLQSMRNGSLRASDTLVPACPAEAAHAVQLELPFGIAARRAPAFGSPAAPKGVRLM